MNRTLVALAVTLAFVAWSATARGEDCVDTTDGVICPKASITLLLTEIAELEERSTVAEATLEACKVGRKHDAKTIAAGEEVARRLANAPSPDDVRDAYIVGGAVGATLAVIVAFVAGR